MDKILAARRLSAALGRPIKASMIEQAYDEGLMRLEDGSCFMLAGGNSVFVGPESDSRGEWIKDGYWMRNGKPWNPAYGKVRPL